MTSRPVELPARVTVPLLQLITQQSLDEDYQHVADRRRELAERPGEGPVPASRTRRGLTAVAVILFGLLVTIAGIQTSRTASITTASNDQLIARIDDRRAEVADEQKTIASLRAATTKDDARYGTLGTKLSKATATQKSLLASTGWGPVHGAGVEVRIDDAPNGGTAGEVRDSDLAGLVNGLWQAGATAIAINGQRLTALSSLRNSGTVVRVDGNGVSLSPPYTVDALGDTHTLQSRFLSSTSGIRLHDLTSQYGMPFSMHNEGDLTVPAASSALLRLLHARELKETP